MMKKKKTMTIVEVVVLCLDDGWMHKVTSLFVLWFESVFFF